MATKKQIEKKKKARESKSKARVAYRRHKLDELKKQQKQGARLENKFRERIAPIINDSEAKQRFEESENKKNAQKLEKNMQILKALEEEYLREQEVKKQINQQLEAEGHMTLQEKMKALEEKARAGMTLEEAETGMIDQTVSTDN
jgi:hypothetical protein